MNNNRKFIDLREKYPRFIYKNYTLSGDEKNIRVTYDFYIEGLCEFHPTLNIGIAEKNRANPFDCQAAEKIIFSIGLIEMISYWKAACPKEIVVECGYIDKEDILWLKKLFFNGLGEFLYRNEIRTDFDGLVKIKCKKKAPDSSGGDSFISRGLNLIPVGGGKDSNVSLEILSELKEKNRCFIINPRGACLESAYAAGYSDADIISVQRTIDRELLSLNALGFLNGHTPFSAIVAFVSLYCSYVIGSDNIILSNEASANEGNINGLSVNHQYSKSYEFEKDFNYYVEKNITKKIKYFSLLRPFSELGIAKRFAACDKYHKIFKSCNLGGKTDSWCAQCPKCLFVYSILLPFTGEEALIDIFGKNMLGDPSMLEYFDGLVGFSPVKPFECVGTTAEINFALSLAAQKMKKQKKKLPYLLDYYVKNAKPASLNYDILKEFNGENNIPPEFEKYVKEMYRFVSSDD